MTCRKIYNSPQHYAWGSMTLIPDFMKTLKTGQPQAEVWFGTHPLSTACYYDDDEPISNDVELGFMLKVLAAEKPLSIQVHPSKEQAEVGFVKENLHNVAMHAYTRNYKDDNHKPEMIIAISDEFYALCGFQSADNAVKTLEDLLAHVEYSDFRNAIDEFKNLLTSKTDFKDIVRSILSEGAGAKYSAAITDALKNYHFDGTTKDSIKVMREVANAFPHDEGLAVAVMMNPVILKKGEALFLPAGNIHAYVKGLGIEVMANSDNVLRGGLTTKYIDVDELLKVLDANVMDEVKISPVDNNGLKIYEPIQDFSVIDSLGNHKLNLKSKTTLCIALENGSITVDSEQIDVERGEVFIIQDESDVVLNGHFIAAHEG